MTFKSWLLFLVMETALSLSPGPAVFYVVSQGAKDFARAVPATFGILSANAAYFVLSASSLGALIAASARFFSIAKWVGAAYLIYLGINALRSAVGNRAVVVDGTTVARETPRAKQGMRQEGMHQESVRRRIYLGALTLQLSNPKALLFFLALLPQFLDTQRSIAPQMTVLAATSMLPEICILLAYGWLANRAARASAHFGVTGSMNRWLAWIEGVGLLGCATLVLKVSRS